MAFKFMIYSHLFSCILTAYVARGAAPEGKMYVYASYADGCATVSQSRQNESWRCRVNNPIPFFYAKYYEANNEVINATINVLGTTDQNCIDAVKSTLCSQITPTCLQNGTEVDFGDVTKLCAKIKSTCPKKIMDGKNDVCATTLSGKYNDGTCIAPSKPIEGVCPQPDNKMPPVVLEHYTKASKQFSQMFSSFPPNNPIFPPACIDKMKGVLCMRIACSQDEKHLLIKEDQGDCQDAVNTCFNKSMNLPPIPQLKVMINNFKAFLQAYCPLHPNPKMAEIVNFPQMISTLKTTQPVTVIEHLKIHKTTKPSNGASNSEAKMLLYILFLYKLLV